MCRILIVNKRRQNNNDRGKTGEAHSWAVEDSYSGSVPRGGLHQSKLSMRGPEGILGKTTPCVYITLTS